MNIMHIILLKFGPNKSDAPNHMAAHNAWIAKGISDGIFQCVGSLDSGGGCIIAKGENKETIEQRVKEDPFVQQNIAEPEIYEIDVKRTSTDWAHLFEPTVN